MSLENSRVEWLQFLLQIVHSFFFHDFNLNDENSIFIEFKFQWHVYDMKFFLRILFFKIHATTIKNHFKR